MDQLVSVFDNEFKTQNSTSADKFQERKSRIWYEYLEIKLEILDQSSSLSTPMFLDASECLDCPELPLEQKTYKGKKYMYICSMEKMKNPI